MNYIVNFIPQEPSGNPDRSGQVLKQITASVILGSPLNKCSGPGICRVFNTPLGNPRFPRCLPVEIQIWEVGELRILFRKVDLSPTVREYYFDKDDFLIEAEVAFPASLCEALGQSAIRLAKGRYVIRDERERYVIHFPFSALAREQQFPG